MPLIRKYLFPALHMLRSQHSPSEGPQGSGEQVSWGERWWDVATGIQPTMTETGTTHAGSCGDGHPHLTFCVLITLGGQSPAVLSECHARHTPHTRTGEQPCQPLWINKHPILWGRQQPHLRTSKARSRPLPHLHIGQHFLSEGRRSQWSCGAGAAPHPELPCLRVLPLCSVQELVLPLFVLSGFYLEMETCSTPCS